ncbi:MAG TPA: sigma-70 family RNA polymerase sigma factor [Chthoniobacterales bacterium]|nr:sigma-70 family RNA polymerase sigma factor [Chthoniobacterales bacterium]
MGFTILDHYREERDALRKTTREDVNRAFRKIDAQWQRDGSWDEQAWGILWEFYRGKIRTQVDTPDAFDDSLCEVTDALIDIFRRYRAHTVEDPASYIATIVKTAIAGVYRRRQRETKKLNAYFDEVVIGLQTGSGLSGAKRAMTPREILQEAENLVEQGLATPQEQTIFELRFLRGFSLREIAEKIGRDKNNVFETSKRMLQKMRDAIRRREAIPEIGQTH